MLVKTGLKAGGAQINPPDDRRWRPTPVPPYPPPPPPPYPGHDYTCDHCFGQKNSWGGLDSATCNSCW